MDFSFTEEQHKFRQEVRGFSEEEMKNGYWQPTCDAWIQAFDGIHADHMLNWQLDIATPPPMLRKR